MYSQFFQIGEVLEYVCWKLSDVVHAQVTVETKRKGNPLETVKSGSSKNEHKDFLLYFQ